MGHYFSTKIIREYDIRGVFGVDLTQQDALALGRTLGMMLTAGKNVKIAVVGYDGRHSSPILMEDLCHGLNLSGMFILNIGLVASPMLYFATHILKADLGVMVTGSHNAPEYNGFKMVVRGKPFYGQDLKRMAEMAQKGFWLKSHGMQISTDISKAYIDRILQNYRAKKNAKSLSIGWDPGHGALAPTLNALIPHLSGRHFIINGEVDGNFPAHHPDPTIAKNLIALQNLVHEKKCDMGIAFDGDGDRIGLIDGLGRIIWGDQILALLSAIILPHCPPNSPVIFDVKASQGLIEEIKRLNGKPIMSATGHSIIKSTMNRLKAPLAGEMSGHIFIAHHYYEFDDALHAALRLIDYLETSALSLAQLVDQLPSYINTPEIRIDVADEEKFNLIEKIKTTLHDYDKNAINEMDGLRVEEEGGWWLVRASNTQPCIVLRIEAKNDETLQSLAQKIENILRQFDIHQKLIATN